MKTEISTDDICSLVLIKMGKPKDYIRCMAINLFGNTYRVNIYSKITVDNIDSQRISNSYFISYDPKTGSIN